MTKEIILYSDEELKQLTNQELLSEIEKLSPVLVWQVKKLATERTDLYKEIISRTKFLNPNIDMSGRLYCIEHGIIDAPLCSVCKKNPTRWNRKTRSFARYCSARCREDNPETQMKREETCNKLYGGRSALCSEEVRKKSCMTNEQIYGDAFPQRTESCKEKIRQTNIQRRGVEYPMQSKEVQDKSRQSNIFHFGVDNPMKSKEVQLKAQETCERQYGHRFATQVPKFKEKSRRTMISHYGVEHALQSHEIMSKLHRRVKTDKFPGVSFDSRWELKVYEFLFEHGIEFQYQPEITFQYEYMGKNWIYHPDFYVNGKVYEVKGDHFFRINEETG